MWTVLPFALYLLVIAVAPIFFARFWESNRNKLIVAVAASIPAAASLLSSPAGGPLLLGSLKEYAAFIALLAALFVISGGIFLKGSLAGTPAVNTLLLASGAVLANVIGTTGASMLLIRPLLRANASRARKTHLVVFFIFIVSNAGGLLTPLGDPPLFLGFLRGVPFLWTLQLWAPWAVVNALLLAIFHLFDRATVQPEREQVREPLRVEGAVNLLWLLGVIAINAGVGRLVQDHDVQKLLLVGGMGAMIVLSLATTAKEIRPANRYSWKPVLEVTVIFIGIFVTMVPATEYLRSISIRPTHAWQFFWSSGLLSSVLDNAPTYVTFATLACGLVGADPSSLDRLIAVPAGALFLKAISCGSVFGGALTYIGNGPNFMVKAIAEENQVPMPGFLGYMRWSVGILIPVFVVVTLLFFRG